MGTPANHHRTRDVLVVLLTTIVISYQKQTQENLPIKHLNKDR